MERGTYRTTLCLCSPIRDHELITTHGECSQQCDAFHGCQQNPSRSIKRMFYGVQEGLACVNICNSNANHAAWHGRRGCTPSHTHTHTHTPTHTHTHAQRPSETRVKGSAIVADLWHSLSHTRLQNVLKTRVGISEQPDYEPWEQPFAGKEMGGPATGSIFEYPCLKEKEPTSAQVTVAMSPVPMLPHGAINFLGHARNMGAFHRMRSGAARVCCLTLTFCSIRSCEKPASVMTGFD